MAETAADSFCNLQYPRAWTKDPLRKPNNMYASRLSKMLNHNEGTYRGASKSQVQLVHTQSIYGQINVPICEINRLYQMTSPKKDTQEKRSATAQRSTRSKQPLATPTSENRRFKPKNSYASATASPS